MSPTRHSPAICGPLTSTSLPRSVGEHLLDPNLPPAGTPLSRRFDDETWHMIREARHWLHEANLDVDDLGQVWEHLARRLTAPPLPDQPVDLETLRESTVLTLAALVAMRPEICTRARGLLASHAGLARAVLDGLAEESDVPCDALSAVADIGLHWHPFHVTVWRLLDGRTRLVHLDGEPLDQERTDEWLSMLGSRLWAATVTDPEVLFDECSDAADLVARLAGLGSAASEVGFDVSQRVRTGPANGASPIRPMLLDERILHGYAAARVKQVLLNVAGNPSMPSVVLERMLDSIAALEVRQAVVRNPSLARETLLALAAGEGPVGPAASRTKVQALAGTARKVLSTRRG